MDFDALAAMSTVALQTKPMIAPMSSNTETCVVERQGKQAVIQNTLPHICVASFALKLTIF